MIGIASLLMVGDGNPMFPNDSDDGMVAAEAAAVALAMRWCALLVDAYLALVGEETPFALAAPPAPAPLAVFALFRGGGGGGVFCTISRRRFAPLPYLPWSGDAVGEPMTSDSAMVREKGDRGTAPAAFRIGVSSSVCCMSLAGVTGPRMASASKKGRPPMSSVWGEAVVCYLLSTVCGSCIAIDRVYWWY